MMTNQDGAPYFIHPDYCVQFPITAGLKLWIGSIKNIFLNSTLICLVAVGILWSQSISIYSSKELGGPGENVGMGFLALGIVGVFINSTVLSRTFRNHKFGIVLDRSLLNLFPWLLTWTVMILAIALGYFLFILPGLYLTFRLFWADEFALAHGYGPIRAIKESWTLTRDVPGLFSFHFKAGIVTNLVLFGFFLIVYGSMWMIEHAIDNAFTIRVGDFLVFMAAMLTYSVFHSMELAFFHGLVAIDPDQQT